MLRVIRVDVINFNEDQSHLEEKVKYLTQKINQYNKEKLELQAVLENEKNVKIAEIENEIKNYKKISEGYIKTSAKLTEEIVKLKSEIAKYLKK
jgi:hypothetical protein